MTSQETKYRDLVEFKSKLKELKPQFEERLSVIENKSKNIKSSDKEIASFKEKNGSTLISLKVGGKSFKTKLKNLISCRDSYFYMFYAKEVSKDKITTEFSFDRNNQFFGLILDYLRTGIINFEYIPRIASQELLLELEFFGIWPAYNILYKFLSKVEIIKFEGSPQYSNAGTHSIEGINDLNNKGGICVRSPFEIIFELNCVHELKGLEIKGYDKNTSLWASDNGYNAKISVSTDKKNYTSVGTIPNGFGYQVKQVTFPNPVLVKYVKFKHSSYLGIGYINFLKE